MAVKGGNWFRKLRRSEPTDPSERSLKIVIGLGNPGLGYRGTRHNAGFDTIDALAEQFDMRVKDRKFGALVGRADYQDQRLLLVKPQQFMNRSGQVAATILGFYKLSPDQMLVITDDLALEPGRIRLRAKGSAGGHNGLADIIEKLGSREFARLRVGIGSNQDRDMADYVLSRPNPEGKQRLAQAVELARQAVLCWALEGVELAMNKFNGIAPDHSAADS